MSVSSGERNALLAKKQKTSNNRATHFSGYTVNGVPARCARCGSSGKSLRAVGNGKYICVDCLERGEPIKKVVAIGKDLWCRYFEAQAEANSREKLLQYLVDRGASISESTQMDLCEKSIAANIAFENVSQEVRDVAASHGGSMHTIQFGPAPYSITITI